MSWLRILSLIVLAMNLGVAAWWIWRPAPEPAAPLARTDPDLPGLTLLSEAASANGTEAMPPALRTPGVPTACYEVGPFLTQVDLRRAMNALTPQAMRIQFRETRSVIRRGWRVYIASPGSREAALDIARLLSARGLDDYYVVTAGDEQNTISLGVYRDPQRAERRQAEVAAQGFSAAIAPRNDELPEFWIDLEVAEQSDWRRPLGGYTGVSSAPIPCNPDELPGPPEESAPAPAETAETGP